MAGSNSPAVHGSDDEIVSMTVRQILLLIRDDASVEVVELVAKLSYGPGCELTQITHGVAGVLPTELYFAVEGEVVTDKYLGAGNEASG